MQPVLGRALGRPVCRRRPVDGYRQNPPSWNAKTRPEDGKTALCINLCPETPSATASLPEQSALPKASGSMTGPRSPTPPTASWSWSSSSGDGDDKDYRGVVDECSEAVVRHVRRAMNTCCMTHVANEVRGCFGVLMREAVEPAFLDDIVNQILQ